MGILSATGFELGEKLHDSRQTRVYRARRTSDGSGVILKILGDVQARSESVLRFRREYELTRSIADIPGVIQVLDLVDIDDALAIVSEDIGGESLDRTIARGPLDIGTVLELAILMAGTIGAIHQRRIIHKDINPANIIRSASSGELRLIDFGVASLLSQEQQDFLNPTQLEGTLAYTAPEQTGRVNRKLDYRADLYSFGITLYELLTGVVPFASREGIELVHAHIALTPTPPHRTHTRVPEMLSRIVMRLIEKMADDRYQSAAGVRHDLERCLAEWRLHGSVSHFPLGEGDVPARFHAPQKLYGRDRELATILAAFDQAATGPARLLLVKGPPGVGKSALVREVHKPLTARNGNFISGKFDQYQRDVPFYPWTLAFQDFCNLLLQEDEISLARWRTRIIDGIGNLGRVLTDVVPSIELIIGRQPEVAPLSGEQALNRLNYVFGNFIRAISTAENPLVVFIDDWQWADAGSLSLLNFVLAGDSHHLLVIGAYRDNEVDSTHPLHAALADIARGGSELETVQLGNLDTVDVDQLMADALGNAPGHDELSRLVFEKTRGNAFFVVQLLNDLHERSIIRFDLATHRWTWSPDQLSATGIADSVVQLMAERIRSLPPDTQEALEHAACIGDRFQLKTLARILGARPHLVANSLEPALQEGIVVPLGSSYRFANEETNTAPVHYQFIHDRVRQAAYGLIDETRRERVHFDIARQWLERSTQGERERQIFDIANQYNAGRRLVTTADQRRELLEINRLAGQRARQAADHATALNYFRTALELCAEDCWTTHAADTASLLLLAADAALLCQDYAAMEGWIDDYLAHVGTPLQLVAGHRIRLQAYVAQNRLSEAVDIGLSALRLLGTELSRNPGKARVLVQLIRTRVAIRRKSFTDLHALPEMTDPVQLATMDLLGLLLPPAYWTSPDLLALVVFQMVRDTLTRGYSPNAGYGLSWWGITESAMLGNIEAGVVFGEFAIQLARKYGLNLQQPLFFSGWIIHKYRHPLRESLPLLEQTYAVALEKGDFEYASYARNNEMQVRFHIGTPLPELLPAMEQAHRDLLRFDVGSSLYWHDIWWQAARNFSTETATVDMLCGPAYDEAVSLPQHLKVNDNSTLFLLYCAKTMLANYFGKTESGLAHAREARLRVAAGTGMYAQALFNVHESLLLLANSEADDAASRQRALKQVTANQKQLAIWSRHSPNNHQHQWCLVEAERLRIGGDNNAALDYYEQAVDLARKSGFIHEEALANEIAARFHYGQERHRLAAFYLRQAMHAYERWGCQGKIAQLRARYPMELLALTQATGGSRSFVRRRTTTGGWQSGETFDIAAVTQASLAISGEIVIDNLIKTLLKIVIEHGGAQRAVLVLKRDHDLSIEAVGTAGDRIDVAVEPRLLDAGDDLPIPRTLIHYVARTGKTTVLDDARNQTPYARDPYFLRERPISVLCEPLLQQGKLIGMLYLENNVTAGAFSRERLDLLRMIGSQAAISIDNAILYAKLEEKVEERTQKLQESLAAQEHLNRELQASGHKLEAAYAQLREANRQLEARANTDGLTGLANRRFFAERLSYEVNRCAREEQSLTLLICDLDNFKHYNDIYGHVAGDECLQKVSDAIRSVFGRTTDLVARYGGEEFVVLLPSTTRDEGSQIAERMRETVAALGIEHRGNERHGIATISVGCHAMMPTANTRPDDVIREADKALYMAKANGRNCIVSSN